MTAGNEHDHAFFEEQIAVSALHGVAVPDIQDFEAACGLIAAYVHQC